MRNIGILIIIVNYNIYWWPVALSSQYFSLLRRISSMVSMKDFNTFISSLGNICYHSKIYHSQYYYNKINNFLNNLLKCQDLAEEMVAAKKQKHCWENLSCDSIGCRLGLAWDTSRILFMLRYNSFAMKKAKGYNLGL